MKGSDIVTIARDWVTAENSATLQDKWYYATRDVFLARLETLLSQLQKQIGDDAYLLTAIIGEIGNNSFDHNLGNWPDMPGIFFATDIDNKLIVLADRGLGIKQTLSRVKPDIKDSQEALTVAFTEILSGRSPERRGNGLKFVVKALAQIGWSLQFSSGNAEIICKAGHLSSAKFIDRKFSGCIAILSS